MFETSSRCALSLISRKSRRGGVRDWEETEERRRRDRKSRKDDRALVVWEIGRISVGCVHGDNGRLT